MTERWDWLPEPQPSKGQWMFLVILFTIIALLVSPFWLCFRIVDGLKGIAGRIKARWELKSGTMTLVNGGE